MIQTYVTSLLFQNTGRQGQGRLSSIQTWRILSNFFDWFYLSWFNNPNIINFLKLILFFLSITEGVKLFKQVFKL